MYRIIIRGEQILNPYRAYADARFVADGIKAERPDLLIAILDDKGKNIIVNNPRLLSSKDGRD